MAKKTFKIEITGEGNLEQLAHALLTAHNEIAFVRRFEADEAVLTKNLAKGYEDIIKVDIKES